MEILFYLWKDRNFVLFTHIFLDVNIAMYTKACICNNVIMQIQVQANKVAFKWLTCRSFLTTGAMPLALWLEFLLMPRPRPPRLVAAASGATPQAATRTLRALRIPTITLPVVVLVVGDAALPHHPMVVLAGP